jgi:hypothetical protein
MRVPRSAKYCESLITMTMSLLNSFFLAEMHCVFTIRGIITDMQDCISSADSGGVSRAHTDGKCEATTTKTEYSKCFDAYSRAGAATSPTRA